MEPIRLNPACISCLIKSRLEDFAEDTTREKKIEYMQKVLEAISKAPKTAGAPVIVNTINQIQKELFGFNKSFSHVKEHFNDLMMEKVPGMKEELSKSEDALKLAIQYAMTGNYIDFGALEKVDENELQKFLDAACDNPVDEKEYVNFKEDLKTAEKIVYLTDNCGEIVTDKMLIEEIIKRSPKVRITVIVRGMEVLNDATIEDAAQIGMMDVAEVIGNGSGVAGTDLDVISEEAKKKINSADMIISKGQGNFETLQMCGKNIYYIFMCKCEMFAERFRVPRFYGMLINDKNISCSWK